MLKASKLIQGMLQKHSSCLNSVIQLGLEPHTTNGSSHFLLYLNECPQK